MPRRPKIKECGKLPAVVDREYLEKFCPPGGSISLETIHQRRWRAEYDREEAPNNIARAFVPKNFESSKLAALVCLKFLWDIHEQERKGYCPWDWSTFLQ